MAAVVISPVPVGKVGRLVGKPLRADVAFEDEGRFMTGHEVQLAIRAPADAPAWDSPIWRASTMPFRSGGGAVDSPVRPKAPAFVTLDGCPAAEDMKVGDVRPEVLLRVDQPIASLDWELINDLASLDGATEVRSGISDDGLWISFRPVKRLRRSGQTRRVALAAGVFKPPFEPPRDRTRLPRFHKGITYVGHSEAAVDFNRGVGRTDEGDPVYAAAKGTVVKVVANNGEVHISHQDGWSSVYAHMDPVEVSEGEFVGVVKRIGRVGDTYFKNPDETISPHLHHQQARHGTPVPMSFEGRRYELDSRIRGFRRPSGRSEAVFRVRVTRASDGMRSRFRKLRFEVSAKASVGEGCSAIDRLFDGDEVPPGEYSVRYRVTDSRGRRSPWEYDHSLAVRATL